MLPDEDLLDPRSMCKVAGSLSVSVKRSPTGVKNHSDLVRIRAVCLSCTWSKYHHFNRQNIPSPNKTPRSRTFASFSTWETNVTTTRNDTNGIPIISNPWFHNQSRSGIAQSSTMLYKQSLRVESACLMQKRKVENKKITVLRGENN